jgi:cellulose synthase/poly-beta-1,6-N-acetylglucosamine synthase-like glycosyltransferase
MQQLLFYLALVTLLFCLGVWAYLFRGLSRLGWLRDVEPAADDACVRVSIIVPARNEEREIEGALQSLLRLDYPDYEVLVVNDRSTDRTGEILARMQQTFPQLSIATVTELPAGWLGKNHAMYFGAMHATCELLLFTDADIHMQPDTLRRAVAYLQRERLDFLPMGPDVEMPGWLLESFVVIFVILFALYIKPWKLRDPKSPAHVGIGAFNLIRADVYRAIGTHQAIAMRPDDDVKLGKLVKKHGYLHDVLNGSGFMKVRWYASLSELIHGLEKNSFAVLEYRVWMVVLSSLLIFLCHVWPFIAVWITTGATRWTNLAIIAIHASSYLATAWQLRARLWSVVAYPLVFLLMIYIQWRTMFLNYWLGGIRWRDTLYPLKELRANKV